MAAIKSKYLAVEQFHDSRDDVRSNRILFAPSFYCFSFQGLSVPEHSKYQQNIIRNYYDNRETISLQRAQELVTELYLTEGKKRQKHWKSLEGHLLKLSIKQETIDHLIQQDDPQLAAQLIQRLSREAG